MLIWQVKFRTQNLFNIHKLQNLARFVAKLLKMNRNNFNIRLLLSFHPFILPSNYHLYSSGPLIKIKYKFRLTSSYEAEPISGKQLNQDCILKTLIQMLHSKSLQPMLSSHSQQLKGFYCEVAVKMVKLQRRKVARIQVLPCIHVVSGYLEKRNPDQENLREHPLKSEQKL